MGDICEVGTRTQSVMDRDSDLPLSIHLMLCTESDIIHVNALGTSMVILNSYEVATDLLDQRSGTYSSRYGSSTLYPGEFTEIILASIRPQFTMLHEL